MKLTPLLFPNEVDGVPPETLTVVTNAVVDKILWSPTKVSGNVVATGVAFVVAGSTAPSLQIVRQELVSFGKRLSDSSHFRSLRRKRLFSALERSTRLGSLNAPVSESQV